MVNTLSIVPMVYGSSTNFWIIIGIVAVVVFGVIGIMVTLGYQSRQIYFTISDEGLSVGPDANSMFIPREDIITGGVKVVNLKDDAGYRLQSKASGGSVFPGFSSGWYLLANEEVALVYVTDRSRVVYIPTNKEYSVLLSVSEAEEFAADLHNWAMA